MRTHSDACSGMLTHAHVCCRMLMYADVCSRMLTHADACLVYVSDVATLDQTVKQDAWQMAAFSVNGVPCVSMSE